jgi:hypothetical protein
VEKVEEIDKKNGRYVLANKLTSPTEQFPVYERRGTKITGKSRYSIRLPGSGCRYDKDQM